MLPVVTGVITLATALGSLATWLSQAKDKANSAGVNLDKTLQAITAAGNSDLVTFTKVCRMEPLVLLDDRLRNDPVTPDLMQVLTSIIAGYYLQTFALLGQVSGIDVIGTLDKLNPSRTGIGLNSFDANDEYIKNHKLVHNPLPFYSIGMEALLDDAAPPSATGKDSKTSLNVPGNVADIYQATNLAVGKMIKAVITADGNSIEIPITIRTKPVTTDPVSIAATLSIGSTKNNVKERWQRFRAGELTFSNFVFMDDVVQQHKSILIKDKSGFYAEVVRRANGNLAKGVVTGNLSMATNSNIIVITAPTAQIVARELGGELSDYKIRESVFKTVHCNILVIVNQDRGMVNFYYRGETMANTVSVYDLKLANKGNGPDIMSIFTAFAENKIPPL
ncbi:hypothetical protein pEaSNUABM37_00331 [Erwinia phage pEa_SNUABM_37]|nr:hypothetical protein pEaSNUABM37_00331 [Erwinia phage pEa_SNUABM_37]QXO10799.1 hypothetical protein pEaSNUABM48_00331 [Erwinia phage pEa_SNUABM_48]